MAASFNADGSHVTMLEESEKATPRQNRVIFRAADLFNYLYGYTPIHLVDPTQLYRERQRLRATKSDNGTGQETSWCDICCEKHNGECPMHGPLHSLRKLVNAGQSNSPLEKGSILKFPDEVCLCTSSIPCVGYGVCARKRIPAGTWIGPYEGKLVRPEDIKKGTQTEYMWEVFHDGQVSHYLDGKEEHHSSWMRFVRCARHKKEQNMVVFQYHGCVYYRTVRDVLPGQELLVWYDSRYSQFMGVPVSLSDSGSRGVHPPRDLVAQEKVRARDKSESGEPVAKRVFTELQPAQRGRPPLRRSMEAKQTKGTLDIAAFMEGRRSYRNRSFPGRQTFRGNRPDLAVESSWRCNQCLKVFTSPDQLEAHRCSGAPEGKSRSCPHCNRTFTHDAEFRIHMELHINERPFRCGYCASAFASAAMLNQHVRVHMNEGHNVKLAQLQEREDRDISHQNGQSN